MYYLILLLLTCTITCFNSNKPVHKNKARGELPTLDKKKPDKGKPKPTYCNAEWCDPSHEPYPNIVSIMTGYNILKGNPFTTQTSDPGFSTGYIFVPTVRTDDGTYALHSGVTVRENLQCSLTSSSETIKTVDDYLKKIKKIASLKKTFVSNQEWKITGEAGIEKAGKSAKVGFETTIPPLIASAFISSKEYNTNKKLFTEKQGVVTLRDATCATYTVRISPFDPPPFSDGFKKSLSSLNTASTVIEKLKYFGEFVQEFGTHFLQQTTMGARTAITRRYSLQEFVKSTDEQIQNCIEDRLNITIAGFGFGRSSDSCKSVDLTVSTNTVDGIDRESITSYGSKPAASLVEWSQQKFESPLPIKMKLSPITNLFSKNYMDKDYMKDLQINFANILSWFEPLYKNYCEEFKNVLDIDECNPASKKQCGWSDNCIPRQQICKNIAPENFFCCDLACMNSPCENGALCQDITNNNDCNYECLCKSGWRGKLCNVKIANFQIMKDKIKSVIDESSVLNNERVENDVFAKILYNKLKQDFSDYYFAVNSYNEYESSETETHAVIGENVHFYKTNKRNIVVGWSRKNSLDHKQQELLNEFKLEMVGYVTDYRVSASMSVQKAWNDFKIKHPQYPVVFMQVVRYGCGLRSEYDEKSTIFLKFSVNDGYNHDSNLVVLFGKTE